MVRDTFNKRLEPLIARLEDLRRLIIEYQTENKQPVFKLEDVIFQLEEVPSYAAKEDKIEKVIREQTPDTSPEILTRKIIMQLSKRIVLEESEKPRFKIKLIRPKAKK